MDIQAVVFDLDGTIINTLPFYLKAYDLTYRHFGFNLTKDQIVSNFPIELKKQCEILGIPDKSDEFRDIYMKNIYSTFLDAKLFEGFLDLITFLKKRGKKTAIVSFAFREYVEFIVKNYDLKKYFDVIISFNDVKKAKPDPEGVFLASKRICVPPHEMLVIGDAKSDMIMGHAAGSKTCFFYPKENMEIYPSLDMPEDLTDYRISSLSEIMSLL